MKNKRGFTLIELLAVIVILALIIVIAVPTIISVINDAKKGAMESDAKLVIDAIEKKQMTDDTFSPLTVKQSNIESILGIKNDNYEALDITVVDGKINVSITGAGRYDGLTATGNYESITITNTPTPVFAFYYMHAYGGGANKTCYPDNSTTSCLGEVSLLPYPFIPAGYLKCDGQLLNIASNPALFSLVGNAFGGNGSTTFALPNLTSNAPLAGINYYMATNGTYPIVTDLTPVTSGNYKYYPFDSTSRDYLLGEIRLIANAELGDMGDSNMILCDGRLLSMASNAALFSLIGDAFGGDGRTNFAIPDLRGITSPVSGGKYYIVTNGIFPSH